MTYLQAWTYLAGVGLALAACSADAPATTEGSTGEATTSSSGEPATATSANTIDTTTTASTGPQGSSSTATSATTGESNGSDSTGESSSTGETTGGLVECAPEEFNFPRSGGIRDIRCSGGSRCYATAVCTFVTEAELRPPAEGWRYNFACDGDWTEVFDSGDEVESLVGAEVSVFSRHRLEFGPEALDYRIDGDFADRFGGIDSTTAQLRRGEALMVASASGESGFGADPFGIGTDERVSCDSSSLTIGYTECIHPRGLSGPGPDGSIQAINGEARMGEELEFLGSSNGYELCDSEYVRRSAGAGVIAVELLVDG